MSARDLICVPIGFLGKFPEVVFSVFAHLMSRRRATDGEGRFFELLAALSSRSTEVRPHEIDSEIVEWLALVGSELAIDRSVVANYLPEKSAFYITSEWGRSGLPPGPAPMLPAAGFVPWICSRVGTGETVAVRSPDALPAVAKADRAFMSSGLGPKATLVFPVIVGGRLLAGITFDDFRGERIWDASLIAKFKLAIDIFGNALERKRVVAEADELREQMKSAARFALLGETSAAIAHELSHPLGAILANAQAARRLLQARRPNLVELREALDDVITAERRAAAYVAKVRSLFRRSELHAESLRMEDLIDSILFLSKISLQDRRVSLKIDTEQHLPWVYGDRVGLEQVLLNLISNAADAVSEQAIAKRQVTLRVWSKKPDRVGVAVSDNGVGIPPEDLAKVFQPLFTTKLKGTGMGLAIVRSIIEAHGSQVVARSQSGVGTTFEFELPVVKELEGSSKEALNASSDCTNYRRRKPRSRPPLSVSEHHRPLRN